MKIIHLISSLGNGGAEKFVIELANEQSKTHDVTIVSFQNINDEMIFPKLIPQYFKLIQLGKKKGLQLNLYWKLYKLFRRIQTDIVHFHLDSTIKYIIPFLFIFDKVKYVYTIHSKLTQLNVNSFRLLNTFFHSKKNIKYVCISSKIKTEFINHFKNLCFYNIPNGVNKIQKTNLYEKVKQEIRKYKKNEATKLAISVGNVDDIKNRILLVKAFSKFKQENIVAIVLGKTVKEDSKIMQEIRKNNSGNVYFLGLKENVGDFLNEADFFVMTSLFEGMPISALEALSVGLPMVSTPAGGMVDLVEDGINGFVSDDFTLENFVKQISSFLDLDKKELQEMKNRNIEKHRNNYSIELCSENYIELYTAY